MDYKAHLGYVGQMVRSECTRLGTSVLGLISDEEVDGPKCRVAKRGEMCRVGPEHDASDDSFEIASWDLECVGFDPRMLLNHRVSCVQLSDHTFRGACLVRLPEKLVRGCVVRLGCWLLESGLNHFSYLAVMESLDLKLRCLILRLLYFLTG